MSKTTAETILIVTDLEIKSREKVLVTGVNFTLKKGRTLGIVGESGSGKTITNLAFMKLLPAGLDVSAGEIFFTNQSSGISLVSASEKQMENIRGGSIGMIFQEPMTSLNPAFTCGSQVQEVIEKHLHYSKKRAKERVIQLFEEVKLPEPIKTFHKYPHQLSGGQRQRVMIAMAISCNPALLIADEPTTALDVRVQKSILDLLKSLQQKYVMSILFISHDFGVISSIADDILVMYQGKVVEQGDVNLILENPQHPYTRGLLACRPAQYKNLRPLKLPVVQDFLKNPSHQDINFEKDLARAERLKIMYETTPLLKIQNLEVNFATKKNLFGKTIQSFNAVKKVNFSVWRGETLGLVGESGCGKTTLGRTILHLVDNFAGNIYYKDEMISGLSSGEFRKFRKSMQIIFQDPYSALNPKFTVSQSIIEPILVNNFEKSSKNAQKRVIALLEKVNLGEEYLNRYVHELSGGQRQRVVIARALAMNPEFLICDESVAALDVSVQSQILNLLNDLKRELALTYIFISHDLSVVRYMADRIIVMKNGELVEEGEADFLYNSPQHPYTQSLINSIL